MSGEMAYIDQAGIDSNGERWYLHAAVAKALNGRLVAFDTYRGPYIVFGVDLTRGNPPYSMPVQHLGIVRLWLIPDESCPEALCRWYNEANNKLSSVFMDGDTAEKLELAIEAAREVL